MFKLDLGKYRKILFLIGMFLVFDVGVLGMTFLISKQISADAVSLNLAGQQRTLVQQLTKTALLIEQEGTQGIIDSSGKSSFSELNELFATTDLLNSTLEAFEQGGKTLDTGEVVELTPQDDPQAAAFFALVKDLWVPVNKEIQQLRNQKTISAVEIGPVLQVLVADNLNLLTASNMLTSRMESLSAGKASALRMVQIAGITLALINFVFILSSFLGQLRKSDIEVERAHKETENILRTTQEGLFLLDSDFRIGSQTSAALGKILGVKNVAGENFLDLLRPLVSPKTFDTTKEYIELLMRHDVKEKLVASLNPLDCIEISTTRENGAIDTRHLQIKFNRVVEKGVVTHLLITANDISRRVRLERELKDSERKVQDQMGMMVHILQADPQLMQEFLKNASEGLDKINEELRTSSSNIGLSTRRVDMLMRTAHRLKGDAAALNLETVAQSLHAFETLLDGLRSKSDLNNEDFLPVTVRVKGLYAEISAIQEALARIAQVRGVITIEPSKPAHDPSASNLPFVVQWRNFAQQIAQRMGKHVDLSYQGLDLDLLTPTLRESINSMVNQFIRNTMTHGIEDPLERRRRGKQEAGHVSVYLSDLGDGHIELSFRDDGAGINIDKLREAAVRNNRMTRAEADAAKVRELVALIFEPGISTRETIDEDAGRGAGLDSVKEMVTGLGGRVRIGNTQGEYCHFRVQLPLPATPRPLAAQEPTREAA